VSFATFTIFFKRKESSLTRKFNFSLPFLLLIYPRLSAFLSFSGSKLGLPPWVRVHSFGEEHKKINIDRQQKKKQKKRNFTEISWDMSDL
jgi:hypothetical protein